jgi:MFS family permease
MSTGNDVGKIMKGTVAGSRAAARGTGRAIGAARHLGGAHNPGLMRMLDVHAAACAGDTLVVIGLLSAVFFTAPVEEARAQVAVLLLVAMVPFAVVAPLIGPVLDRFRHGRRFALAASLLGRAVLAWIMAAALGGPGLYLSAFGILLLSRTYGVARSGALARLVVPVGLRLSQASARSALYGTAAGAVAAAIGAIAATFGPQWPLRVAGIVFLIGAAVALALPPLADADSPEVLPKAFGLPWRTRVRLPDGTRGEPILSGRLVGAALLSSGGLRLLYGFLLLFLAFALHAEAVDGGGAGPVLRLTLVAAAFGAGTFLATAIGAGLRITRPVKLQATGVVLVALAAVYATIAFSFLSLLVLCFATAVASGLAKLAVDATLQERIPAPVQATAFARSDTLLMLAWVAGAAIGLVPFVNVRIGIGAASVIALAAGVVAVAVAWQLRGDVLRGHPASTGAVVTGTLLRPEPGGPPAVRAIDAAPLAPAASAPAEPAPPPSTLDQSAAAPPGFHVFRPTPPSAQPLPPTPPVERTPGDS